VLREHAVLFLEIRDHVLLMALDPPGEHHEQQLKRLKRWGHCSGVYWLTNRRGSSSSRLAHCPIASFEFLDTTGVTTVRNSNGTKAAYNPHTGNAAVSQTNQSGVKTTQTSRGGHAKTKNGMGVVTGPNGTTCVKGPNNQGCTK
jgi:hypothetical protein